VTYVVRAIGLGRVKIGTSENVSKRVNQLRSTSPVPLELVGTTSVSERTLQRRFTALRTNGEWFSEKPPLVEWLAVLAAEQQMKEATHAH
jgi:hypothetical protein